MTQKQGPRPRPDLQLPSPDPVPESVIDNSTINSKYIGGVGDTFVSSSNNNNGLAERQSYCAPLQSSHIVIGASVKLVAVDAIALEWGVTPNDVTRLLDLVEVPRIVFPGGPRKYVSVYALESAIFELTLPDGMKKLGEDPTQNSKEVIRMHQELAGVMYMAGTRQAIKRRVVALGKTLGLQSGRKSVTIRRKRK